MGCLVSRHDDTMYLEGADLDGAAFGGAAVDGAVDGAAIDNTTLSRGLALGTGALGGDAALDCGGRCHPWLTATLPSWRGGAALGGGVTLEYFDRYEIESFLKVKSKLIESLLYYAIKCVRHGLRFNNVLTNMKSNHFKRLSL